MLTIDGAAGEGGGQILRTSLALSLATGTPFRIERIRAGRAKPGLLRQHLTAVTAAATIGDATVDGARLGAQELVFKPGSVRAGDYHFAVGTAGSAGLVFQTVLPPLLAAASPSTLALEGGTHNPAAPPFDFLQHVFLPLLARTGALVDAVLERPGFYPAGGGRFSVRVTPATQPRPLALTERGAPAGRAARAVVARLSPKIAARELAVVKRRLGWADTDLHVVEVPREQAIGPGNVVMLEVASAHVTEIFTAFGAPDIAAEAVAEHAVAEARRYLAADVPVGPHLADQLLVPLALGGGGVFRTLGLTPHATTNIEVIRRFLDVPITVTPGETGVTVEVRR
jgi:RNA 3'-terminal phosphate cyclase (ATP)